MSDMSMIPIPIPPEAAASRPNLKAMSIGPPRGVSDEDCGTVGALVGIENGYPMYADYWRPTPEQLEALAKGGFIELIQYAPRMVTQRLAREFSQNAKDRRASGLATWPACATYPNLGCVCRGALGRNKETCTRKRTGDLTPLTPAPAKEALDE